MDREVDNVPGLWMSDKDKVKCGSHRYNKLKERL